MRYRAAVLFLCVAMVGGVVAAAPAQADPVDCVLQLATDLQNAPPPDDPSELVTVSGLDIDVNTNWSSETIGAVTAAALRFAECATPNPEEIIPCITGVVSAIVMDIAGPHQVDEVYLRYVHLDSGGVLHINGNLAASDAGAIAACA